MCEWSQIYRIGDNVLFVATDDPLKASEYFQTFTRSSLVVLLTSEDEIVELQPHKCVYIFIVGGEMKFFSV